jgi:hypothetical protein
MAPDAEDLPPNDETESSAPTIMVLKIPAEIMKPAREIVDSPAAIDLTIEELFIQCLRIALVPSGLLWAFYKDLVKEMLEDRNRRAGP